MTDSIESRVKKLIVERLFLKIAPEALEEDKALVDDYGVDSVSLLELVVGLEEEFAISVGDEDFNVGHFKSVASISAFVRRKLAGAAPGTRHDAG